MHGINVPAAHTSNMRSNTLLKKDILLSRCSMHQNIDENINMLVQDLLMKRSGRILLRQLLHEAVDNGYLDKFRFTGITANAALHKGLNSSGYVTMHEFNHPKFETVSQKSLSPLIRKPSPCNTEARDQGLPQSAERIYTNAVLQKGRIVEFLYEDIEPDGTSQTKQLQTPLRALSFPSEPTRGNPRRVKN